MEILHKRVRELRQVDSWDSFNIISLQTQDTQITCISTVIGRHTTNYRQMLTNAYYWQMQFLIRVCATEVVAFLHKSANCKILKKVRELYYKAKPEQAFTCLLRNVVRILLCRGKQVHPHTSPHVDRRTEQLKIIIMKRLSHRRGPLDTTLNLDTVLNIRWKGKNRCLRSAVQACCRVRAY
jgi:hypothetical protein